MIMNRYTLEFTELHDADDRLWVCVSTIRRNGAEKPFETRVISGPGYEVHDDMRLYVTEAEARAGHTEIVQGLTRNNPLTIEVGDTVQIGHGTREWVVTDLHGYTAVLRGAIHGSGGSYHQTRYVAIPRLRLIKKGAGNA